MATTTNRASRLYDLVVFGVTGYTGRYVAEEIHRIQTTSRKNLSWAVAGRNLSKIKNILQDLDIKGIDVLEADVSNEESIKAMCSKTRVVLNVVGPYVKYGEVVVKCCIRESCDYVDITGEEYFVEQMIMRYSQEAQTAGVYIVNHCGYDSIPSEMGAVLLRRRIGELEYVECYMEMKTEVVNTGTWESLLGSFRFQRQLAQLRKNTKNCRMLLPEPRTGIPKRRPVFYSPMTGTWCLNMNDGPDKSCLRRSGFYRQDTYGSPEIACNVYISVGSFFKLLMTTLTFCVVLLLNLTSWGHQLLCKYPKYFTWGSFNHGGPTKQQVERSSCRVVVEGAASKTGSKARVTMQGAEPAYAVTSVTIVHSAMCLLEERDKLPRKGGIYSPGAAYGETSIVERMETSGRLKFTMKDL